MLKMKLIVKIRTLCYGHVLTQTGHKPHVALSILYVYAFSRLFVFHRLLSFFLDIARHACKKNNENTLNKKKNAD